MNIETIIIQFLILYLANLILDYPLQGTYLATEKGNNTYLLWVHCAIWGLGLSILLIPLGLFAWWKVIMLVCGHFVVDYWKARQIYKSSGMSEDNALLVDQMLHVIQLVLCLV